MLFHITIPLLILHSFVWKGQRFALPNSVDLACYPAFYFYLAGIGRITSGTYSHDLTCSRLQNILHEAGVRALEF